jgi:1-deoxy-D-xylulose-5-phosphate reductoisomerase
VLNAANEVAVEAFLSGRLRFTEIAGVIARVLDACAVAPADDLEGVLDADARARGTAAELVERVMGRAA